MYLNLWEKDKCILQHHHELIYPRAHMTEQKVITDKNQRWCMESFLCILANIFIAIWGENMREKLHSTERPHKEEIVCTCSKKKGRKTEKKNVGKGKNMYSLSVVPARRPITCYYCPTLMWTNGLMVGLGFLSLISHTASTSSTCIRLSSLKCSE